MSQVPHQVGDSRKRTRESINADHFIKNPAFFDCQNESRRTQINHFRLPNNPVWQSKTLFIIKLLRVCRFYFSFRIAASLMCVHYGEEILIESCTVKLFVFILQMLSLSSLHTNTDKFANSLDVDETVYLCHSVIDF